MFFSFDVTGGSIEERCRADFCAPAYAHDKKLTSSGEKRIIPVRSVVGSIEGSWLDPLERMSDIILFWAALGVIYIVFCSTS